MTQKISGKKLKKIFEKTKGHCAYCGNELISNWEVEHIIPKTKGGGDKIENLLPCCLPCNRKKRDKTLSEFRGWIKEVMEDYLDGIEDHAYWLEQVLSHKHKEKITIACSRLRKVIQQTEIKFYIDSIMEDKNGKDDQRD